MGTAHNFFCNIRRTNQANKDACFKFKHCYWSYLPDRNRPQRTSVYGGIRRIYAFDEQERPYSRRKTIGNSKKTCTIMPANGTITTTEEATVYVKDMSMLITVQLLKDSPAVRSPGL